MPDCAVHAGTPAHSAFGRILTVLLYTRSLQHTPRAQGAYSYPDGSVYVGSWAGGRRHGGGTYWDAAGGCLRGSWAGGQLAGQGQYDQAHHHFEGRFARGLPAGGLG